MQNTDKMLRKKDKMAIWEVQFHKAKMYRMIKVDVHSQQKKLFLKADANTEITLLLVSNIVPICTLPKANVA